MSSAGEKNNKERIPRRQHPGMEFISPCHHNKIKEILL